jgi:type IV secretion system protein VirB4
MRHARSSRSQQQNESSVASRIPYEIQLSFSVVRTAGGAYVMGFRVGGASFECADEVDLNNWHERLHAAWRNLASPHLALWTHIVRERAAVAGVEGSGTGFAERVALGYREQLARRTLWRNTLYLTVVYRPHVEPVTAMLARWGGKASAESVRLEMLDALEATHKIRQNLIAALAPYQIEELACRVRDGQKHSEFLELVAFLINGEWQRVPLPYAPITEALATSRLFFGQELIEYRQPTATRLGAMLAIKEYATPTVPGLFNALLSAPYAFVLTQSFAFLTRAAGQALLTRQLNRLGNAGDLAVSQAEGLKTALDALSSGDIGMGDHHLSLQVLSEAVAPSDRSGLASAVRRLNDHIADARSRLADTGILVAREDLALEAAFWAQLPGQFSLRPRVAPISTRNFAGMNPLHNHPQGSGRGHWGAPVAILPSSGGSPYALSLHRADIGHTFLCGPTGSGKTVLVAFLVALYHRRGVTQVLFDKDRGLEILVRALGGQYLTLRNGQPTGCNPLALPVTPSSIEFLRQWLRILARPIGAQADVELSAKEEADLDQALRGTLALEPESRRLSRLIEYVDRTDPEGLHARLRRWCASTNGEYAWVFDQTGDAILPMLAGNGPFGFDVTEYLDHPTVRTPLTLYLFHLVRQLLDGRPLLCWLDEFWRMLSDPAFEQFAKDGPKTWRKLNGAMCLATQSASDVLASPLSHTIVEQTATKIFFPNVDADAADYREGFGLSARQFELVKTELSAAAHQFLIKQGHDSAVCHLDLSGMPEELAVLSSRAESLRLLDALLGQLGTDPAVWLPAFWSARRRDGQPDTTDHPTP